MSKPSPPRLNPGIKLPWLILPALTLVATVIAVIWAMRPIDSPRTSAPKAPTPHSDGSPSWSSDSKQILFYSDDPGTSQIFRANADGSNRTQLTHDHADNGYPNFSPDGHHITFDSDRDGNFEIYTMNPDGSNIARLTQNPARDVSPSWSPDGRTIAFMSDRAAQGQFDIWLINADGNNPRQLTHTTSAWFPRFSPDGKTLAFHVGRDVHTLDLQSQKLTRLTTDPDNGMYPDFSPDGKRITFMSWRDGHSEVYLMNADGSQQTRLTHTKNGDAIDPRFSPDGSQIVYIHLPNALNTPGPKIISFVALQ